MVIIADMGQDSAMDNSIEVHLGQAVQYCVGGFRELDPGVGTGPIPFPSSLNAS